MFRVAEAGTARGQDGAVDRVRDDAADPRRYRSCYRGFSPHLVRR